ncbi:MAG: adenine phosphoribosyltransferase [Candidatus Pacebacteria bacterium CG10_big_fil_rev_8_21_14_0_10_56_10]|nr:MAG: adenine phosphoribosyltransferase [Candidatus Pacebacteria bacterium CG10_big_fil_rev_8_21_14_0_10_56_10]
MTERSQHKEPSPAPRHDTYPVTVAGVQRDLRLFEIKPGVRIAILNILGDTELVQAVSKELAPKLKSYRPDILVTAEAKGIPLIYALAVELDLPYVVLRKKYKPYMGNAMSAETLSITTGEPQTLFLDEKDRQLVVGKRVILIDDVISTGSTLQGMRLVTIQAQADVVAEAAIFTEGDRAKWSDVIALGHLPVFIDNDD